MSNEPTNARECYIASIQVSNLWGYKNISLPLSRETNLLIGKNATGKTSVINILRHLLALDIESLLQISFDQVVIHLRSYEGDYLHTLSAVVGPDSIRISLDDDAQELDFPPYLRNLEFSSPAHFERTRTLRRRQEISLRNSELRQRLMTLVPAVWLPVNREVHGIPDESSYRSERGPRATGADERLNVLLLELKSYRLALEARLSASYKEFEKRVLSLILYNKEYDNFTSIKFETPSTSQERDQLFTAFQEARLLDDRMRLRIREHFASQDDVLKKMVARNARSQSKDDPGIDFEDIFIIPLIRRTKEMIKFARELETEKRLIFSGLEKYTKTTSSFLEDKSVSINDSGELVIDFQNPRSRNLSHEHLSSGEKQILILLTQALIYEGKTVVYVADEPELSLHVTWQEQLLGALKELNPRMQLIIATHSPDIVGSRPVLDLERYSKNNK